MGAAARAPESTTTPRSLDPGTRGPLSPWSAAPPGTTRRPVRAPLGKSCTKRPERGSATQRRQTSRPPSPSGRSSRAPRCRRSSRPPPPGGHRHRPAPPARADARGSAWFSTPANHIERAVPPEEPAGVGAEPEHGPRRLLPLIQTPASSADVGAIVRGPAEDRGRREQLGRGRPAAPPPRRRRRRADRPADPPARSPRPPSRARRHRRAVGRDRLVEAHHVTDEQRGPQRVVAPPRRLGRPLLRRHVVDPDGWHRAASGRGAAPPGTPVPP